MGNHFTYYFEQKVLNTPRVFLLLLICHLFTIYLQTWRFSHSCLTRLHKAISAGKSALQLSIAIRSIQWMLQILIKLSPHRHQVDELHIPLFEAFEQPEVSESESFIALESI